ncbi:MAG: ECF-type sigma factor [Acidobacteriota bacterium]
MSEVSVWLQRWNEGDSQAAGRVAAELSDELRKIAAAYLRNERSDHTLQPTALVNELYLRLIDRRQVSWRDRGHFFAFAARTLRRILVDHARQHRAEKRSGAHSRVTLVDHIALTQQRDVDLLDLDRALDQLAEEDERLAQAVELRFFGGLTLEETAAALELSSATVKRDLRAARAFLLHRLRQNDGEDA